jgi:hypothetical protein
MSASFVVAVSRTEVVCALTLALTMSILALSASNTMPDADDADGANDPALRTPLPLLPLLERMDTPAAALDEPATTAMEPLPSLVADPVSKRMPFCTSDPLALMRMVSDEDATFVLCKFRLPP